MVFGSIYKNKYGLVVVANRWISTWQQVVIKWLTAKEK